MHTAILTWKRFTGKHTTDNIVAQDEEVINNYGISTKVSHIITDNASNMVKVFSLPLYQQPDLEAESDSDQEINIDSDGSSESDNELNEELFIYLPQHDGCFAHMLQLVIKDGMKELGSLRTLVSKVSNLVSHIHKSTHTTNLLEEHQRVQKVNAT